MSKKLVLPAVLGLLSRDREEEEVSIPSHKIEQKKQHEQLSKRKLQKMKGKRARKNRGRNRKEGF